VYVLSILITVLFWQPPVTNTPFAERTRETMHILRDHLLGSVVSQRNLRDIFDESVMDNNNTEAGSRNFTMDTFRQGVVEFFCPTRQQWGIFWEEAGEHQNLLDYMSSATLLCVLIDEGHRRIVRRLQTNGYGCANDHAAPSACSASSSSRPVSRDTHQAISNNNLMPTIDTTSDMLQAIQKNKTKHSRRPDVGGDSVSSKRAKNDSCSEKAVKPKTSKSKTKAPSFHDRDEDFPAATRGGRGSRGGKRKAPVCKQSSQNRNCRQSQASFHEHNATATESDEILPPPPPPVPGDIVLLPDGLSIGQMIVMPRYVQANDPHPLFYFLGMSNSGMFQFYVGPELPQAVFNLQQVILPYKTHCFFLN